MIEARDLSFSYNPSTQLLFEDIKLSKKENLLIIGPSGVGKTTLLHLLAGILKPEQGQIIISNTDITKLSGAKLDKFRGKHIGLIFQKPHFVKSLSVLESLLLVQHIGGNQIDRNHALQLLKRLGIDNKADSNTKTLSQGQLQRLTICCALINKPEIILADEPTSNLDDENCHEVVKLLKEQSEIEGSNLVIITHDNRLKSEFKNVMSL